MVTSSLSFKLVGENQIGMMYCFLIGRDNVFVNI